MTILEHKLVASREDGSADVGHEPEDLVVRGPPIDQQTDGHHDCTWEHERDTVLALALAAVLRFEMLVDLISRLGRNLRADEEPQTERYVVETTDGGVLAVEISPESGEGCENEVEHTVDESDVDRENLHDRLSEDELEGALEGGAQMTGEAAVGHVEFGVQLLVAGDF